MYAFQGSRRIGFVAPRHERAGWVWLVESETRRGAKRSGACLTREAALHTFESAWRRCGLPISAEAADALAPRPLSVGLITTLDRLWRRRPGAS